MKGRIRRSNIWLLGFPKGKIRENKRKGGINGWELSGYFERHEMSDSRTNSKQDT